MHTIEFSHINFEELLQQYSKHFATKIKDNFFEIPTSIGKGYLKYIPLSNGLQVLIKDFILNDDITLQRLRVKEEFFILRLDEISLTVKDKKTNDEETKSSVLLANSAFDWIFLLKKHTHLRSINILFSKEWLHDFLDKERNIGYVKKYLSLKLATFNYESLNVEYKRLMYEILNCNEHTPFESLVVQNRVMLLIERFFSRIFIKINDTNFDLKVSEDDLQRLVKVEEELVKDYSVPPPGIPKLARMAAMSSSKLKIIFKDIYGLPIYQYFQKHRMNKAKAMLLSQKYTVKEVGLEIGYSNLSNFAKAFKKSFDQLPSDLLENKNV